MEGLSGRRKEQLDYIGITADDLLLLQNKKAEFSKVVNVLVDELYERIMRQPELRRIIEAIAQSIGLKRRRDGTFSL